MPMTHSQNWMNWISVRPMNRSSQASMSTKIFTLTPLTVQSMTFALQVSQVAVMTADQQVLSTIQLMM